MMVGFVSKEDYGTRQDGASIHSPRPYCFPFKKKKRAIKVSVFPYQPLRKIQSEISLSRMHFIHSSPFIQLLFIILAYFPFTHYYCISPPPLRNKVQSPRSYRTSIIEAVSQFTNSPSIYFPYLGRVQSHQTPFHFFPTISKSILHTEMLR